MDESAPRVVLTEALSHTSTQSVNGEKVDNMVRVYAAPIVQSESSDSYVCIEERVPTLVRYIGFG